MKPKVRPPRRKERFDIPDSAYQALKKVGHPLPLKELINIIENLTDISPNLSLSALHTELNLDGRFIFLSDRKWALKSQVPHLRRRPIADLNLLEEEYEPLKDDYKWKKDTVDSDDDTDDESELLVPYDEDNVEEIALEEEAEEGAEEEEEDDEYPEK